MPGSRVEPPVSEAELHGFVDGGLDRARSEAVQAFLAASPADAARVETWRRQNEKISAAFASMKTSPLPWSLPLDSIAGEAAGIGRAVMEGGHAAVRESFHSWRERWSAHGTRIAVLAFMGGVLLAASVDYITNHLGAPDDEPVSSSGSAAAGTNEAFAAQARAALRAFGQSPAAAPPSGTGEGREQELAAPVLPNLPVNGLKLAGLRAVPGEQGHMLCMFYGRPDASNLALCVEKTPGPAETLAQLTGNFPSASISWRQKGAAYVLTGALPEPELRALADEARRQVEAFDGKDGK